MNRELCGDGSLLSGGRVEGQGDYIAWIDAGVGFLGFQDDLADLACRARASDHGN